MKKLQLLLLMLLALPIGMLADSLNTLVVVLKNGSETAFFLKDKPNVTFEGTDLKVVTDLERIGDQVADICELLSEGRPYEKQDLLVPLFNTVQAMIHNVLKAYVEQDLERAKAAADMDDQVDTYFADVRDELVKGIKDNTVGVDEAIDLVMTAKHLERAGDHATNIYEWLEFMMNGTLEDVQ